MGRPLPADFEAVAALLASGRRFLLTGHRNPDGDSLGSALAAAGAAAPAEVLYFDDDADFSAMAAKSCADMRAASAGLSGSIGGGAEQLFGKKKSKGYEAILSKITVAGAAVFIVCTLVLVTLE